VKKSLDSCWRKDQIKVLVSYEDNNLKSIREAAPYCHEHDTRFFRNVWKNGRVSWSHRKADGSGFCRYKG
jgi:hypothetical protein